MVGGIDAGDRIQDSAVYYALRLHVVTHDEHEYFLTCTRARFLEFR